MPEESITRAQQKTIENLLECRTIAQAAERSQVSERTIYRWFKERPFRLALNEAPAAAVSSWWKANAGGRGLPHVAVPGPQAPTLPCDATRSVVRG